MSICPEARERALKEEVVAAFWASRFSTAFRVEDRPVLPAIPMRPKVEVADVLPGSPNRYDMIVKNFPKSKPVLKSMDNPVDTPFNKSVSADEADNYRSISSKASNFWQKVNEIKKAVSVDEAEQTPARKRLGMQSNKLKKKLPPIPLGDQIHQFKTKEAIVRADIIHHRREGTVEEFDEMLGIKTRNTITRRSCPGGTVSGAREAHNAETSRCKSASLALTSASASSSASASASAGAGAGGSVRSGALTQYQLVHRAVENKLNAHKALIDLVSISVRCLF